MANFNTHVSAAFLGAGGAALLAINTQLINWLEAPWLVFLGTIGGLLPDIDSDNSKQVKTVFFLLAMMSALTLLTEGSILQGIPNLFPSSNAICHATFSNLLSELSNQCIPYSLILITASVFLFVRYPLFSIFKLLTVHRGVFHSLLAALFFALLTTCTSYYFLKQQILFAWLSGLFITVGFIIHLLLDEIYSVDLANSKLKRSFGTALKLYGYRSKFSSTLLLLCIIGLYSAAPSIKPFIMALKTVSPTSQEQIYKPEHKSVLATWLEHLLMNLQKGIQTSL